MSNFQTCIGGNAACMKRLTMATRECVQLTSNETYFVDIWFRGVKTAERVMAEGVDYYGPEKTIHKGFCLAILEKLMKYWPGGSYHVINSTTRVPGGRPLMAIVYKYNYRKVLGFIYTEGAGSTEPGDPYLSLFPDIYSNVSDRPIVRPHLLGRHFNA